MSVQEKVIATNSRAYHDYFIEETYEAGISLMGTEVKALREGRVTLRDSFARVEQGEVYLYQCHISPYSHGNISNHDPLRRRKLLLHREEIRKLFGRTQIRGYTLLPTKIYFKKGLVKIELALGKGKKTRDKRESLKKKEAGREISRAVRARQKQ
jgi:SsrA-binding protein